MLASSCASGDFKFVNLGVFFLFGDFCMVLKSVLC